MEQKVLGPKPGRKDANSKKAVCARAAAGLFLPRVAWWDWGRIRLVRMGGAYRNWSFMLGGGRGGRRGFGRGPTWPPSLPPW